MKYIRTPEGIFEFEKRFDLEYYRKLGYTEEQINNKFIRNGNRLADTIEELCDAYIVFPKDGKPYVEDKKWDIYDYKRVYGAIFTKTDLIAVAELKDDGELELL